MTKEFRFDELNDADLVVGAVYRGGNVGTLADEPLSKLVRCGNLGGFRQVGTAGAWKLVVLFTTFADPEWPDRLDPSTGLFTYYGDNKEPGRRLHDTPRGGNEILREVFEYLWVRPPQRDRIPPFFVFSNVGRGRDVRFEGLAAPGAPTLSESEDLVATWKTQGRERFLNYRSVFTILDADETPRSWITDLLAERSMGPSAPRAWRSFVETGVYQPLRRRD